MKSQLQDSLATLRSSTTADSLMADISAKRASMNAQIEADTDIKIATMVLKAVEKIPTPSNGVDGVNGIDGKDGVDGATGEPGKDGIQGPQGEVGPKGPIGIPGPSGERGEPGKDGRDGIDGKDGKDGKDGRDGRDYNEAIATAAIKDLVKDYQDKTTKALEKANKIFGEDVAEAISDDNLSSVVATYITTNAKEYTGKDGASAPAVSAITTDNFSYVFKMDNGKSFKVPVPVVPAIPGPEGKEGKEGKAGPQGKTGKAGAKGKNGIDGADGISIDDVIKVDDTLDIVFSDGSVKNIKMPTSGTGFGGALAPQAPTFQRAGAVPYDNKASGLSADKVQGAIDEIVSESTSKAYVDAIASTKEDVIKSVATMTVSGTIDTTNYVTLVNASNAVNITLPVAVDGTVITIKRIDGSINVVTILGTIDGVTNPTMSEYDSFKLLAINNSWYII